MGYNHPGGADANGRCVHHDGEHGKMDVTIIVENGKMDVAIAVEQAKVDAAIIKTAIRAEDVALSVKQLPMASSPWCKIMMTAVHNLIAVPWAGGIVVTCIAIVLNRALQRAVVTFLQAGIVVLALWAFIHAEREMHARQGPPIGVEGGCPEEC